MTFREILKLYQDGKLDDTQKQAVESEIEKHEAISDYLYDNSQIPELEELGDGDAPKAPEMDEARRFTEMVNKSIRKAFVKMGVIVGGVILAAVLAVIFVLPGLVSRFYYNPNQVVGTSSYDIDTTRMSLDLAVFTELFIPSAYRDFAIAEPQGYGSYQISIPQSLSITGNFTTITGKLERNDLTLYNPDVLNFPTGNAFVGSVCQYEQGPCGSAEESFARLQTLDEKQMYTAYFSLDQLMDYETLCNDLGSESDRWYAVYTEFGMNKAMGFYPNMSGHILAWDKERYPLLRTMDENNNGDLLIQDSEAMQTHFLSMMQYMTDCPQLSQMFHTGHTNWDEAIQYIEENGLQIYGFCVTTDKETLLKLSEYEHISYVYTVPAR